MTAAAPSRPSVAEQYFIDHRGFELMSQAKNVSGYDLTTAAPKIQVFLSFRPSTTDLIQIRELNKIIYVYLDVGLIWFIFPTRP